MIRVRVVLDGDDCLSSLTVAGHASVESGSAGDNVVCGAVTAIVRACAEAISLRDTIRASGAAARPGELRVDVEERSGDDAEWLRGVTSVMLVGVERIASEAPGEVELTKDTVGERDGT